MSRFELALGAEADARHRLDRLDRVAAGGGFLRQHHRVGAVDHGVGDVEHFGAGRDRAVDHRLQHLRGGDHHAVARQRLADDLLLQAGQFGVADLHAEVAARDHHHVAGVDDLGQVLDRLGALDLRDQRGIAAGGARDAARLVHVRRRCGRTTRR